MNFLQRTFDGIKRAFSGTGNISPPTPQELPSGIFKEGIPSHENGVIKTKRSLGHRVRNYNAAIVDRLTADFSGSNTSFNSNVRAGLKMMRGRSRNLARNDPYTKAIFDSVVRNVVGHDGLRFRNMASNPDGKLDDRANKIIQIAFAKWGRKKTCTVTKSMTWIIAQQIIIRMCARDGEVFIRKVKGFPNAFGYALQIIPADYVDDTYDVPQMANGHRIIMGIEINSWGEKVAYHVLKYNPNDLSSFYAINGGETRERIPASEMTHVLLREDAEQLRGIPWIYVAITRLNQLRAFEEAEVVAARISASKMGFLKPNEDSEYKGDALDDDGNCLVDASPGQIEQLPPGWEFQAWDPQHPNGNLPAFTKAMLRGICAGVSVNYNLIGQDLEGVNFSSIRAGTIDEREQWKVIQQFFIDDFADDVFESWLEVALLTDFLKPLPYSKFDKFNAPYFRGRRWPWVDPEKDLRAQAHAVVMGWKSNSEVVEDIDGDFDEVLEKLKEEKKKMVDAGIVQQIPQMLSTVGEHTAGQTSGNVKPKNGEKPEEPEDD